MGFSNTTIELLLQQFKCVISSDYEKYRNHVYRVFLNCILIDNTKEHEEKYAIAAVFHDLGIWTDHTIDYLNPSIDQANTYLTETGRQDWIVEIILMINWHHKISKYRGVYKTTVETFRRADWIDVSLGLLTYGADKSKIKAYRKKLPNRGFHFFLLKKLLRNLFRHPLNPLPMFKI